MEGEQQRVQTPTCSHARMWRAGELLDNCAEPTARHRPCQSPFQCTLTYTPASLQGCTPPLKQTEQSTYARILLGFGVWVRVRVNPSPAVGRLTCLSLSSTQMAGSLRVRTRSQNPTASSAPTSSPSLQAAQRAQRTCFGCLAITSQHAQHTQHPPAIPACRRHSMHSAHALGAHPSQHSMRSTHSPPPSLLPQPAGDTAGTAERGLSQSTELPGPPHLTDLDASSSSRAARYSSATPSSGGSAPGLSGRSLNSPCKGRLRENAQAPYTYGHSGCPLNSPCEVRLRVGSGQPHARDTTP